MSQHMKAKYLAESRKRKCEMQEKKEEEEVGVSRPAAMTNAERMKKYRLRKKLAQENTGVCNDPDNAVDNPEPIADVIPEPIPDRIIDRVMIVSVSIDGISQDVNLSFRGK